MTCNGILHETLCVYTPQRNGVAKHKNRHLVETIRTILIHCEVSQRFWDDTVISECYLINHMSSSALDNKISHSILLPYDPSPPLNSQCFWVHMLC